MPPIKTAATIKAETTNIKSAGLAFPRRDQRDLRLGIHDVQRLASRHAPDLHPKTLASILSQAQLEKP